MLVYDASFVVMIGESLSMISDASVGCMLSASLL